jgi:hypothetical protein
MRIVIEDDKEPTIEGAHPAIAAGEVVDAGPAPTALIRQFAPELVVEQEQDEKAEKPRRPRGKAETPANPLRAGAAVARRRGGAQTAEPQAGKASEGGGAPKRRSTKKS